MDVPHYNYKANYTFLFLISITDRTLTDMEESELYSFSLEEAQLAEQSASRDHEPPPTPSTMTSPSQSSQREDGDDDEKPRQLEAEEKRDDILRALEDYHPRSYRGRVYTRLLDRVNVAVRAQRGEFRGLVESRRRRCVDEGIADEKEAAELINDPYEPLPSQMQKRRMSRLDEERVEREATRDRQRKETAAAAYESPWVLNKEKELFDLCRRLETTRDGEMKKVLSDLVTITEHKLKEHHRLQGTTTSETLAERKRVCVAMGYVSTTILDEVKTVYERLPPPTQSETYVADTPPSSQASPVRPPKTPSWVADGHEDLLLPSDDEPGSPVRLPLRPRPPKTPSWTPRPSTSAAELRSPFRLPTRIRPEEEQDDEDDEERDMFITPRTPRRKQRNVACSSQRAKKSKTAQSTPENNTLKKYFRAAKK